MDAYLDGDGAAFRELYKRLSPILLRVMRRELADREEASDLVQQTFLQVHRARNDFNVGFRVRPWVFTIAMNLKRDHFRRVKRRREAPLELDGRDDPGTAPRGVERAEASDLLRVCLGKLDRRHRAAVELHWFEGLSFQEVASRLGAPRTTAKVWAHRGYAGLRQAVTRDRRTLAAADR